MSDERFGIFDEPLEHSSESSTDPTRIRQAVTYLKIERALFNSLNSLDPVRPLLAIFRPIS
jgi:hypothetical protein